MITLIVATDAYNGIGIANKLPWCIPEEMKVFVAYTRGKTVIMGRKTFESIGSKPLPKRFNIVCTRTPTKSNEDNLAFTSIDDEQWSKLARSTEEFVVIGGEDLYISALPWATRIVKSTVRGDYECDAFFPKFTAETWVAASKLPVGKWQREMFCHGEEFQTDLWTREYYGELQPELF